MTKDLPFRDQFQILMDNVLAPDGSKYSTSIIAQATGLSEQSLLYMLDGRTQNPRLDSLRSICRFYQISLDYFDCDTKADCQTFLAEHIARVASPLVHEINKEADELSPVAKNNVLRLLDRLRFLRRSRKHKREEDNDR